MMTALSMDERAILDVLGQARGADAAISIDEIRTRTGLSYRRVTAAIEAMRVAHTLPIGSARGGARHGYFLIESAQDLEATVRPLKHQALSMLKVVHSLEGPHRRRLGELVGQLAIELSETSDLPAALVPARVRGTGSVVFVAPTKAEPCWHCGRSCEGEGVGTCSCAVCLAEEVPGRCASCGGTGQLVWGIE